MRLPRSVCSFGLILPDKGIEQFLELAGLLKGGGNTKLTLIGTAPSRAGGYAEQIIAQAQALRVKVLLDREADEVGHALAARI